MKKIIAIIMLVTLLFNSIGYRFIAYIAEQRANSIAEVRIDRNEYKEEDLIEIKIPFKLPYSTEWKEFERITGEIEVAGKYYKYVKRKVIVDSLVLLCLPDHQKSQLQSAHGRFFELVHGLKLPHQKKSESSSTLKTLISHYLIRDNHWNFLVLSSEPFTYVVHNSSFLSQFHFQKLIKPPDFTA